MKQLRDRVTIVAFVLLVAVSAAAAVQVFRQGLPEPAVIDPLEPIERISSAEFASAPRSEQLRLVRSLEKEFLRGVDWRDPLAKLDEEHWARFQNNFELLARVWFMDKVDTFHALRPRERKRFVEQEMANLRTWPMLTNDSDPQQRLGSSKAGRKQMGEFANRLAAFYRDTDRRERRRIDEFMNAVRQQALERMGMGRMRD